MNILYVDELTVMQQKIVINVLTQVAKKNEHIEEYDMPIDDFKKLVGIEVSNNYRAELRRVVEELVGKRIVIDEDDGRIFFTTWFSGIVLDYKRKVRFAFDKRAKPCLLQFGKTYTETTLENIRGLRCKYSIRLYEMIKAIQRQGRGYLHLTLEELKEKLGIGSKYTRIGDLKRRILDEVKNDISRHTDLQIEYVLLKTGRKYTDIRFEVKEVEALVPFDENKEERNVDGFLDEVNLDELDKYIMEHVDLDPLLRKKMEIGEKNQVRKKYVEEYFEYMLKKIEDDVFSDFDV